MEIRELEKRLFTAARAEGVDRSVPYGFETRIMARLGGETVLDVWAFWNRLLWRAAAPCVALSVALGIWAAVAGNPIPSSGDNLAAEFESTLLAPLARLDETW